LGDSSTQRVRERFRIDLRSNKDRHRTDSELLMRNINLRPGREPQADQMHVCHDPTISRTGAFSIESDPFGVMRLPIGFSPGKYCLAKLSETITTGGEFLSSRSVKARPSAIGVRRVWKYSGVTTLTSATGCWPSGSG